MASVNKVILVGNLGRDPETRTFPSGDQVCNATLATTDRWKDKQSGEMREATEWHRLVFNGRLAEIAAQYLRKGSQIYVEGAIRTRKYTDKDGIEKYATDIRVDQMQMLGSRQAAGGASDRGDEEGGYDMAGNAGRGSRPDAASRPPVAPAASRAPTGFDDYDDDIPF
ncbi:single-stranded DNA-binding protein [uncultured Pseudacidovorax sp.]|uniref:single-stranded DNA-binding protein n=1 Tax=uncultured Pseudacidovorax sp. TaxID=679313 RepID=UPI0025FACAD1|nr:single-stranded DNA-binding protein [uncultured Pseudacidovorax sp.]